LPGQALLIAPHGHERRRPYSIASSPEEAAQQNFLELLIGIDAETQGGPLLSLEPGALVDVEGPVGRFTFPEQPQERRFLCIAGGPGVSPLRAMLHHALRLPHEQIGFLYSARTPDEFAYEPELRALAATGRIELRQKVTREAASGSWPGTLGRISLADLAPLVHTQATLCFVCGPAPLVQDMLTALNDLGVSPASIRVEEWS
jgi:ferredoxin-NADP reductase